MADPRRRRRGWLAAGVGLVALAGTAAWWAGGGTPAATAPAAVPVATATVVRTDLTDTVQVDGSLAYATPTVVVAPRTGLVTALPAPGQVVGRGQPVFELDGRSLPLFFGARPLWRILSAGVTPGPDVGELNGNLHALGYGGGTGDAFGAATTAAVDRWQAALGWPATGAVSPGDVVVALGSLRVGNVSAHLGAALPTGEPVLAATSTDLVVQVALPVADESQVRVGDQVAVTLPAGEGIAPGRVASISPVAESPSGDGGSSQQAGPQQPSVAMVVSLLPGPGDTQPSGNLDQAPVSVAITGARAPGVLAVPVNALVALAGGGYAVQVVDHGSRHLVAVQTGLFAGPLVQVTGTGLDAGMAVEVPAP